MEPRIICPFTDLQEATELALAEYPTQFVDVSGSTEDYFWLLYRLWKQQETFVVVEHDHLPWKGALKLLYECPQELCEYQTPMSYLQDGSIMFATGPVKYSASIIKRYPDLWENSKPEDRYWTNAAEWGYRRVGPPHIHEPHIEHLNPERMRMQWNEYVRFRKENPLQPRIGRQPSQTKAMQQDTHKTRPKDRGLAGRN